MTRVEYVNALNKLLAANGGNENDPQVQALNNNYMQGVQLANAGRQIVDASNQSNQGPIRRPVNPLSDEDIEEANWLHRQIQKEENREAYSELKQEIENPENWED